MPDAAQGGTTSCSRACTPGGTPRSRLPQNAKVCSPAQWALPQPLLRRRAASRSYNAPWIPALCRFRCRCPAAAPARQQPRPHQQRLESPSGLHRPLLLLPTGASCAVRMRRLLSRPRLSARQPMISPAQRRAGPAAAGEKPGARPAASRLRLAVAGR